MGWDQAILDAVAAHRAGWATTPARGLMTAGRSIGTYVAVAVVTLGVAWRYRAWRPVVCSLVAAMVATGLAEFAKELIGRSRPPADLAAVSAGGLSMPSSIGALTAAAATPLVLAGMRSATRAGRSLAALLAIGTVTVGACMVYLGAHWPSDVLVGWALGSTIGAVLFHLATARTRGQTSTTSRPSSSRTG
jgi:undecaprenyl-diphosphatase